MVNDAIPFYEDGDELTCLAGADVLGQHLVMITDDTDADSGLLVIGPATAGAQVLGVAMWDAAEGSRVTVHTVDSHHCMPIKNGADALAANDSVKAGAAGVLAKSAAGDPSCGIVATACAANGTAKIMLTRHNAV
jgi:hypothetical protein